MKNISFLFLVFLIASCGKEQHDLTVKVNIEGLKKGIVYLKKIKDTSLVTIDSLVINGNPQFELYSKIESPEVFFLYLDKNSSKKDRITFFGDKGITEINTTLENFAFEAKIKGSEQQKTLEGYNRTIAKLNANDLDLIKENFEAKKENDTAKLNAIEQKYQKSIRRKYLFTANFAINNKDSEVAPYLVLTELYNARIHLLDTINNSLSPKVKNSKYGKELATFIKNIKKQNN